MCPTSNNCSICSSDGILKIPFLSKEEKQSFKHFIKFKFRNYIHFDNLCSLYKESYIEGRSWSIIFPGAPSQLWMIEYSRTNIKFRSLPLMDVINLSDGIFSAFQTSCTNILWGFFSPIFFYIFLKIVFWWG